MTRKETPTSTTKCQYCGHEMEIKHVMRWHKCPVCGVAFKPCDICTRDKTKCAFDCPLDVKKKPTVEIGAHRVSKFERHNDHITLVFEWEESEKSFDGASFGIHAEYYPQENKFDFYDVLYDLNLQPFGRTDNTTHLSEQDKKAVKRRLRSIAKKLDL